MRRLLAHGLAAGAAGTTALNAVTYLDMSTRGRPASPMPQQSVERMAESTGIDLGGNDTAENRKSGLGALLGIATGVGVATVYTLIAGRRERRLLSESTVLGLAAMAASNVPMTAMGLTNPTRWSASDWAADVVPHAAYGLVAAATLGAFRRPGDEAESHSRRA